MVTETLSDCPSEEQIQDEQEGGHRALGGAEEQVLVSVCEIGLQPGKDSINNLNKIPLHILCIYTQYISI